ncbi:hypothetical protein XENOCAPTIV_027260 [Xenoophorus captivus]|uniref:Uncharacterized protein n=1 Tax=Xenoophorus captivus TaxID=1517983 RepID=A0ABV0QUE7_9TELE
MFEWGHSQQIICFRSPGNSRVTRIRFNHQGNKVTFCCHESGATVLSMVQRRQLLLTGGRKGWVTILELPHRHQRQSFLAHDSPVKALAVDPTEDCFISGSAEGNIKVFLSARGDDSMRYS